MLTEAELKIVNRLRHGDRLKIAGLVKLSRYHVYKVLKGERKNDDVWKIAMQIVEVRETFEKEKEKVAISLS